MLRLRHLLGILYFVPSSILTFPSNDVKVAWNFLTSGTMIWSTRVLLRESVFHNSTVFRLAFDILVFIHRLSLRLIWDNGYFLLTFSVKWIPITANIVILNTHSGDFEDGNEKKVNEYKKWIPHSGDLLCKKIPMSAIPEGSHHKIIGKWIPIAAKRYPSRRLRFLNRYFVWTILKGPHYLGFKTHNSFHEIAGKGILFGCNRRQRYPLWGPHGSWKSIPPSNRRHRRLFGKWKIRQASRGGLMDPKNMVNYFERRIFCNNLQIWIPDQEIWIRISLRDPWVLEGSQNFGVPGNIGPTGPGGPNGPALKVHTFCCQNFRE